MLNNTNTYLQSAKNTKNDEFYTPFEAIEKELVNYQDQFFDKVVLCNCDDPFESDFCRFFIYNFNRFNLRKLICTSYGESKLNTQTGNKGYVLQVDKIEEEKFKNTTYKETIKSLKVKRLIGNGDFASEECVSFLKEADIVVTNPPFSLFRQFISLLFYHKKKFLVIGNMNAITYKEILFFIEAKKTPLNTHDLGQILVYSRICNPEKAFLFSSAGTGSLEKLIRQREDLTFYSQDKRLKMIQIAKWDVARNMPDVISMIPKII